MEFLLQVVKTINIFLSDYILIILLLGCGIFFSVRTRFVQVRCFGEGMKALVSNFNLNGKKQCSGMSPFQAFAAAAAAQIGVGSIVGACGAILTGGPGAVFWMWVIAFFGMATVYAETVLAQHTRVVKADGSIAGGPVYYINRAFRGKTGRILAAVFAGSIVTALGCIGMMVQSNAIGSAMNSAFGIPSWLVGIVIAVLAGMVFIGKVQRLAAVMEKLVPMMLGVYLLGCLVLIACRIRCIPETIGMIFGYAFAPNAIIGGGIGYALKTAVSQGVKRGLYSGSAGRGSTAHAHAAANVKNPHAQGVLAMMGAFIDTFVVLTMTAVVVISTLYADGGILSTGAAEGVSGTNMVQLAFSSVFGDAFGNGFAAICILFFAFSAILSWNYFAKINAEYLFGQIGVKALSAAAVIFTILGPIVKVDLIPELMDLFNNLMVITNVPAIVALSAVVAASAAADTKIRRDLKKRTIRKLPVSGNIPG